MFQETVKYASIARHYLLDANIVAAYLLGKRAAFELAHAWIENEELLGCAVEIVTEEGLRDRIKTRVLREAIPL
jgi:hypothetical protein